MRACPNFAVCNGWCPYERYVASRHDPGYSGNCCGLSGLIEHIRNRLPPPPDNFLRARAEGASVS